jgi:hypothetical protein
MRSLKAILGYGAVGLVLALMFLTPFKLLPGFTGLVGRLGLRPHPKFAGGPVVRSLERGSYRISISAPAGALGTLERQPRFIQVSWSPVNALPDRVEEQLDLDGDGHPDVQIRFAVPKNPKIPLQGQVNVLDSTKVLPISALGRGPLDALLVRLEDRIVARFPVK